MKLLQSPKLAYQIVTNSISRLSQQQKRQKLSKKRIEFIDFAKGFSILGIVIFHYLQGSVTGYLDKAISYAGFGVHLFIILSGFGLTISSYNISAHSFYRTRFVKILLPYYILIVIVFICNQFIPIYPNDSWYAFFGHIFLYKMFDEKIMTSLGYVLWFISMILQLYIAYPFLAKIHNNLKNYGFGFLVLSISCLWLLLIVLLQVDHLRIFNSCALSFLWEFGLGMILGNLYRENNILFWEVRQINWLLVSTLLGGFIVGILTLKGGSLGLAFNNFPAAISFTSLTIFLYHLVCHKPFKVIKQSILFISKISYELYLIHHFLLLLLLNIINIDYSQIAPTIAIKLLFIFPLAIAFSLAFSQINTRIYSLTKSKNSK